jgi:hypothetical protein
MLMHPDRGMRLPRRVSYLALLLASVLGLGLLPTGRSTLPAAWGQEAPETTSPHSTETTAPETTGPTSTECRNHHRDGHYRALFTTDNGRGCG